MAKSIKDLIVRIMVDDKDIDKFQKAGSKALSFGNVLDKAALGAAAALGALAVGAGVAYSALSRIETINAQTDAAITSTGGAANVTREHIEGLAGSLETLTATEAESIQEGANLLLTFKNIKNEAGEGNDVFDQSVTVMTDMARALGTDASSGAMQLGKALNDPVKGLAALSRVGITFTADQEAMIRKMVESGDVMGAQKLMLAELNSQFGGSGANYAATMAGKQELMGHKIGEASEAITMALLPAISGAIDIGLEWATWASENTELLGWLAGSIAVLAGGILVVAGGMKVWAAIQAIQTAMQWANNAAWLASPVTWIILAIIVAIGALVIAALWLYENWDAVTQWLGEAWQAVADWFISVGDGIATWWNGLWSGIGSFLEDTWNGMVDWVTGIVMDHAKWLYGVIFGISEWWETIWGSVSDFFGSIWEGLGDIVRGAWNGILGWIEDGVNGAINLINGILSGINTVGGAIGIHLNLIPKLHIPRLATGGITLGPQLAMVGDNPGGREAILPLDSPAARDLLGGGSGPTDLSDSTIEKLARSLAALMRPQSRQGGIA